MHTCSNNNSRHCNTLSNKCRNNSNNNKGSSSSRCLNILARHSKATLHKPNLEVSLGLPILAIRNHRHRCIPPTLTCMLMDPA